MTNYQLQQKYLEADFVFNLLTKYNIKEVTTQRQAKNGTREFEFPVPCYTKQRLEWFKSKNYDLNEIPRLRIAVFKSGYVRKQNGAYKPYQLNPQYKQNQKWVWQKENGEIYVQNSMGYARALIWSPITRLNYMLKYYLKNYAK
jgi:hypothetical protein